MKSFVFDTYRCARCGQCVAACPIRLIRQDTLNDYPRVVDDAENYCISCNHCVAVCPIGAVSVGDVDGSQCEPIEKEMVPRFDQMATVVRMRRSIRRYADEPMEDRIVEQLLNIACWAPSAKNGLPVRWLVVNGRQKVAELAELVIRWFQSAQGMEGMAAAWQRGEDPIFRGAPCLVAAYTDQTAIWPVVDATIAVETLDLCAAAKRLGTCWAGFFIQAAQQDAEIKAWLGLSGEETVQGALMLGHIGEENYRKIPPRPEPPIRWIRER